MVFSEGEIREIFKSSKDGSDRAKMLRTLRNEGNKDLAEDLRRLWVIERILHAKSMGRDAKDILIDEYGDEYFIDRYPVGEPGTEHFEVKEIRIPFPLYLDVKYWENYND